MTIETVKIQGEGYFVNDANWYPNAKIPKELEEWLLTNTPAQEFTDAELLAQAQQEFSDTIQQHLDSKAKEFRYDSMNSARSYAGYANAFQAEAIALGTWASNCWVYAGQVEADVLAGTRTMPTKEELLLELPSYIGA